MLQIVDKIKIFNWLRWKHHPKVTLAVNPALIREDSAPQTCSSVEIRDSNHEVNETPPQQTASRGCMNYRHKGWMSHLNPLHFERSCGHNRDVQTCEPNPTSPPAESETQLSHEIIEEEENLAENSEITILLGDKQQGLLAVGTFKLNSTGRDSRIESIKVKQIHGGPGMFQNHVVKLTDEQNKSGMSNTQEKEQAMSTSKATDNAGELVSLNSGAPKMMSQLKNRVLPLEEDNTEIPVRISSSQVEKLEKVRSVRIFDPIQVDGSRESSCGKSGRSLVGNTYWANSEVAKDALRRSGSVSSKKTTFTKVPDSPKSPRDAKWWKALHTVAGSKSTMGSPWNSEAAASGSAQYRHVLEQRCGGGGGGGGGGGHHSHNCACISHRRSASTSSYRQGYWITTDSECKLLLLSTTASSRSCSMGAISFA